jgi:hypothetical protein
MHAKFWLENLKGKECLESLSIDGRIILKWTLMEIELESVD